VTTVNWEKRSEKTATFVENLPSIMSSDTYGGGSNVTSANSGALVNETA
jgi:hypothetical protein